MLRLKGMILLLCIILALFAMPLVKAATTGDIVITEVMYSPLGDDAYYEWVELYNNDAEAVDLSAWQLQQKIGANWKNFDDITISAGEYIVIARQLTYPPGTKSFEEKYGDNSGTWGDAGIENYNAVDGDFGGGLVNTGDTLSIKDGNQIIISTFNYGPPGADDDDNTLQLMGNGSICASTPTLGAATTCPYCGDGNCNGDESCSNCPDDCGKCDGEPCSIDGDCASNHCVHGICRATYPYCGDYYCDSGENCPSDNTSCADNKCYEPTTCVNGCGQTFVASGETDEACTSIDGCDNPPCECDGAGNCVSTTIIDPCGDGTCNSSDESCANCPADCLDVWEVCCDALPYEGDCCINANCTGSDTCVNYTCTAPYYCGDGTYDAANETCSNCPDDCEGKQADCGSEKLCCDVECVDLCFSDAGCASGTVCKNPGTCNASCVEASTVTCDLTVIISAEDVFKSTITQSYYLYVNDSNNSYTGSAVVTYWIEDSEGNYIKYHKKYNATVNVDENKSRDYTPLEICGNATYYIKAEISDPKCNETDSTNNAATKQIKIWGLDPDSAECFKNLTYALEMPAEVKAEEIFTLEIEVSNNLNVSQEVEIWSYVYRGTKCYSCYWNETEESNKQVISIPAGSSATVELQNKVNATNGTYYIKVNILKAGFSTPEELKYEVEVIREEAPIEEEEEEEGEEEGEGVIYESKSEKIKRIVMYAFPILLLAAAIYFTIAKREQIDEFFASKHKQIKEHIASKKQEFEKKREWKKYLQKRRPGVIKRLSTGFLKPGGGGKAK